MDGAGLGEGLGSSFVAELIAAGVKLKRGVVTEDGDLAVAVGGALVAAVDGEVVTLAAAMATIPATDLAPPAVLYRAEMDLLSPATVFLLKKSTFSWESMEGKRGLEDVVDGSDDSASLSAVDTEPSDDLLLQLCWARNFS